MDEWEGGLVDGWVGGWQKERMGERESKSSGRVGESISPQAGLETVAFPFVSFYIWGNRVLVGKMHTE